MVEYVDMRRADVCLVACIALLLSPLLLVVVLAQILGVASWIAWWSFKDYPSLRAGDVLEGRWLLLPCAVQGRVIAVRKDMRVAIAGGRGAVLKAIYLRPRPAPGIPDAWGELDPPRVRLSPVAALEIALRCAACEPEPWSAMRSSSELTFIVANDQARRHRAELDSALEEARAVAHLSVSKIKRAWRTSVSDPTRKLCHDRLASEFMEMSREIEILIQP